MIRFPKLNDTLRSIATKLQEEHGIGADLAIADSGAWILAEFSHDETENKGVFMRRCAVPDSSTTVCRKTKFELNAKFVATVVWRNEEAPQEDDEKLTDCPAYDFKRILHETTPVVGGFFAWTMKSPTPLY